MLIASVGCRAVLGIDEKTFADVGPTADATPGPPVPDSSLPDATGPDASCPSDMTACGATCRDTSRDPAHCGGCDRTCTGGDTCHFGACGRIVASGAGGVVPQAEVSNNGYLFWSDTGGGAVRRLAIDTSTIDVVVSPPSAPLGYRRIGPRIYVADRSGNVVSRVVSGPGAVTNVATAQKDVVSVEADETYVYFGAGGEIRRAAREGGAMDVLAAGLDHPTYVRLSSTETGALYVLCEGASSPGVYVVPRDGGAATPMTVGLARGLAVGASHVVTGRVNQRDLVAIDRNPPYAVSVLAEDVDVRFVAVDGSSVFASTTDGKLLRAEIGLRGARVLGRGFPDLGPVAPSTTDRLYWFSAGSIYVGPKTR